VPAFQLHVDLAPRRLRLIASADQAVVERNQPQADGHENADDNPETHGTGSLLACGMSLVMIVAIREE
jgi:hypothetical protein